jgi:acyl-coenzyme A synthetase/AMP-(fatty) acid ligase
MRQDSIKGFDNFAQYWLRSLEKIQKRLGLERYNALLKLVNNALSKYKEQGDPILASNKMSSACLVLACIQSGICSAPIFEPYSVLKSVWMPMLLICITIL